ncbi:MAG: beta-ketoacyl-ACP synthase 3 [Flavobacteriales bacterium]|nr:beta-ketoacyl-ACP synthase 3 [Flavobacteriales bacterium]
MNSTSAVITGFGAFVPGEPISNRELQERHGMQFDLDKHEAATGIRTRHWAAPGQATSHIAAGAAEQALQRAGVAASQLDRIILGTSSPDYSNLAAACRVQQLIGASCPASDITAACAGFIYALEQAVCQVRCGARHVLVIGADTKSRFIRANDPVFGPIFSDGGGAVVLSASERAGVGVLDMLLWSDGSGFETLYVPAGGSMMPATHQTLEANLHGTMATMPGKDLALGAAQKMAELGRTLLERNGLQPGEVDVLIPHQANYYIMKRIAEALGIPAERMETVIHRVGNCIAGTIPIALEQAFTQGRLKPGALVLLVAAGAGYSGGAVLYKVPPEHG